MFPRSGKVVALLVSGNSASFGSRDEIALCIFVNVVKRRLLYPRLLLSWLSDFMQLAVRSFPGVI